MIRWVVSDQLDRAPSLPSEAGYADPWAGEDDAWLAELQTGEAEYEFSSALRFSQGVLVAAVAGLVLWVVLGLAALALARLIFG